MYSQFARIELILVRVLYFGTETENEHGACKHNKVCNVLKWYTSHVVFKGQSERWRVILCMHAFTWTTMFPGRSIV